MTDHQKTCLESLASYAHDVTVVENRIDDGSSDQTDHQARLDVASKDLSQKVEREQSIVREVSQTSGLEDTYSTDSSRSVPRMHCRITHRWTLCYVSTS